MTHFFDKEEERLSKEIEAVILKHLPDDKSKNDHEPEISLLSWARGMLVDIQREEKNLLVWDHTKESEKIEQLIKAVKKMDHTWNQIHPEIKGSIVDNFYKQIDDEEKVPWHPTIEITEADNVAEPSLVIQFLQVALIPSLEQTLSRMPRAITGPGRNKWIAIAAIIQCRRIWELRTQLSAPKQLNAAGPMERFCRDIFEVLEIDIEPTSAFNAWRRTVKD